MDAVPAPMGIPFRLDVRYLSSGVDRPSLAIRLAVAHGGNDGVGANARAQELGALGYGEVAAHARPGVIRMGMGDHRPFHRAPRIDIEVAGFAIKAGIRNGD